MKLFHIQTNLFLSILKIIFFFYLLSYIIDDKRYSEALGSNRTNLQIGITAFGILMIPLIFILGTFDTIITRTQEYSADTYAITHNANPSAFKSALIKLEKESKSIALPNPIYEFFTYTHPSLLKRIENIDKYTH
jgi:STE24 endopeptidase